MSQKVVSRSENAVAAAKALAGGSAVPVGSYKVNVSGGSRRLTASDEFCRYHDMEKGDVVDQWIDYGTGALIIMPKNNE